SPRWSTPFAFAPDAGERTRTSKGLAAQRDLNPPRLPVPPRPRSKRIGVACHGSPLFRTRVAPRGRNDARGRLCAHERRRAAPVARRSTRRLRRQPHRRGGERLPDRGLGGAAGLIRGTAAVHL